MNRFLILSTTLVFGFGLVLVKLGGLMLLDHDRLSEKAMSQYQRERDIEPRRGLIYDRRGRELAVNLDVESLFADPSLVAAPQRAALRLSADTGLTYKEILGKISGDGKRFVWVKRKMDDGEAQKVKEEKIKGTGFQAEVKRFYPKGALAAHVLGFVDMDNHSRAGVERQYESTLMNKGGKVVLISKDATGRVLSQGVQMESRGDDIVLTIDEGLQYIAETALEEAVKKQRSGQGAIIMMDPRTGEILAMAARPAFDPNDPGGVGPDALRNTAIAGLYEPGSTFKIVMGSATVEDNVLQPDARFDCSKGYIEVSGRKYSDAHRMGLLSFEQIIQKSSNVGTIQVAFKLGPERLYKFARKLGFGEKTGIDLPWELPGRLRENPSRWSGTSLASTAIGYEVSVTPLQMLRAYAAVANGGYLPVPHIVKEILSPEGEVISRYNPPAVKAIEPSTAARMRAIFSLVTEAGGTAQKADVKGNCVSGKTGTARLFDPRLKRYSDDYMSSFVGFVPSGDPRLVMIVVIRTHKGGEIYGGEVAAPVFSEVAEKAFAYMNVPRDDSIKNNVVLLGETRPYEARRNTLWNKN